MKSLAAVWAPFLLSCVSSGVMAAGVAPPSSEAVRVARIARPSIVTVETDSGTGTGFVVNVKPKRPYLPNWDGRFEAMVASAGLDNAGGHSYVVTAFHVIAGAKDIKVVTASGDQYAVACISGYSEAADVAVLHVCAIAECAGLDLADYGSAKQGDAVYVLGTALGFLQESLTSGIISSKRNTDGLQLVQFTAAVSPGNSGGPILNSAGEVLGIVRGTLTEGQSLNIGAASPAIKVALVASDRICRDWDVRPLGVEADSEKRREDKGEAGLTEAEKAAAKKKRLSSALGKIVDAYTVALLRWHVESAKGNVTSGSAFSEQQLFVARCEQGAQVEAIIAEDPTTGKAVAEACDAVNRVSADCAQAQSKYLLDAEFPTISDVKGSYEKYSQEDHRLCDAVMAIFFLGRSAEWFDWESFQRQIEEVASYCLLGKSRVGGIWPDPDFPNSCRVGWATKESLFKMGDTVTEIAIGEAAPVPIRNWKDLWLKVVALERNTAVRVTVSRNGETLKIECKTE